MAEPTKALVAAPPTWEVHSEKDAMRGVVNKWATIAGVDAATGAINEVDPVVLAAQADDDGDLELSLRAAAGFSCQSSTCYFQYSLDQSPPTYLFATSFPGGAVINAGQITEKTLIGHKHLIVEVTLPGQMRSQYLFNVSGFRWPLG